MHSTAHEVVLDHKSVHHHEQIVQLGAKSKLLLVKDGPHRLGDFSAVDDSGSNSTAAAYRDVLEFIEDAFAIV